MPKRETQDTYSLDSLTAAQTRAYSCLFWAVTSLGAKASLKHCVKIPALNS